MMPSKDNRVLELFRRAAMSNGYPVLLADFWLMDVPEDSEDLFAWTAEGDAQIETTLEERLHARKVLRHYVEVYWVDEEQPMQRPSTI